MPLILGTNSIKDTGYKVANSVRLNQGDHAHFSKTPSTSNGTTFTYSFWVKRGRVDVNSFMLRMVASDLSEVDLLFESGGTIRIQDYHGPSGTNNWKYITNRLFRDPSAWMHILYVVDTNNGTASDRVQLYINGVRETSFSSTTNPSSGDTSALSKGEARGIGGQVGGSTNSFDGYMAEVVYVDGTAKSTTDFGEFDEDTGIWKPIDVSSMSLGSNGWYLDFEDSSSLGNDASGSNNWTSNNLTSIDQTTDTCTNNFATLNPLATNTNTSSSNFSEGNLELDRPGSTSSWVGCVNTMGVTQGKWYAEYKVIDAGDPQNGVMIGVTNVDLSNFQSGGNDLEQSGEYGINYYANGNILNDSLTVATYTAMSDGDIVMIALDIDNGKIYWGRNGTWENSGDPTSGATGTGAQNLSEITTGDTYCFNLACREDGNVQANYGNPPFSISSGNSDGNGYGNFEYSVPSGYYSLNTKNLAEYG